MSFLRPRPLVLLLIASLGLNAWVAHHWWWGRRPGVVHDIARQSRTEAKADLFQLVPVKAHHIVLLGDSHFEYFPATDLLEGLPVVNRGISGETAADLRARLGPVLAAAPRMVVLLAGANDIFQERREDDYLADMRAMLDACTKAGTAVMAVSIPPNALPAVQARIDAANRRLATQCAERAVHFVDLDPMLRRDGLLDPSLTFDGLHLNAQGYLRLAETLRKELEAQLGPA